MCSLGPEQLSQFTFAALKKYEVFQHVSKTKAISKTHTEVCWGDFSSHRDLQKHFCPTFVPSDWQPVHVEHFCVWNRTCTSVVQVVVEVVDFPHMSLVQIVQSRSCAHKSSAEARMKPKCGMSVDSWTCVSPVSGDICSQKATIFTGQSPSRHLA